MMMKDEQLIREIILCLLHQGYFYEAKEAWFFFGLLKSNELLNKLWGENE